MSVKCLVVGGKQGCDHDGGLRDSAGRCSACALEKLMLACEADNYDAKPAGLVQGAALQREDLSSKTLP